MEKKFIMLHTRIILPSSFCNMLSCTLSHLFGKFSFPNYNKGSCPHWQKLKCLAIFTIGAMLDKTSQVIKLLISQFTTDRLSLHKSLLTVNKDREKLVGKYNKLCGYVCQMNFESARMIK